MMKKLSILLVLGVLLGSCQETTEDHHEHNADEFAQSHTVWTDKTELFIEYAPLIVGQSSEFLAHFSDIEEFRSIDNGQVTVSLIKGKKGIRHKVDAPSSPGIFKPSLKPKESGIYDLVFEITSGDLYDRITIEKVEVFSSQEEMMKKVKHEEHNPNQISFLKEQSWKMEFANAPVLKMNLYNVIPSSGEIHAAIGDEKTIVATTSGIVMYSFTDVTIGAEVNSGERLFTISGGNINANNVQTEFMNAKANYTREKANLARKKELYDAGAIAKTELENAQLSHDLAESNYQNIANNYSQKGKSINSTSHGFIKQLFKIEGQYVEAGEPLAIIAQNKRLTLESFVNQMDYEKLNPTITANFSFNGKTHSIEEYNGKFLSYGVSITHSSPKIPVYFELDNTGNLLPGSFVEVWLKTGVSKQVLTVPKTALLEQYGKYSVIVQLEGETFEERDIMIGSSDGINVEVISGLKEDERVVTAGAYQIKMASMSGELPAHGHAH
ncbi:MAG: efflux RND transporter periplasmic adaptor subunit [Crocinitomicaceae bacterium]|nr:efflux RND transporter periplasmic adaptor subunit [Crocinitomicaceae bacterium]